MALSNGPAPEQKTMKLENTEKRDALIEIEKRYQHQWQESKVFEADAPDTSEFPYGSISQAELHKKYPKWYGTAAYAYMNGTLHVGHSFTYSKLEYASGFQRMNGNRVLFPWGYHCTGLPIKACADKLVEEVNKFGKDFSGFKEEDAGAAEEPPAPVQDTTKDDVTKFTAKKGKLNAKTVKAKYQFQIMLSQGIPKNELYKFADAQYWLEYFPPLCKRDFNSLGMRIDWRRQFVTTDANPYYDAFIRWQMNRLHELEKIRFGARYTIYSPKDGQPCMDHDRAKGEAVLPQEYTALKLKVKEWSPKMAEIVKGKIHDSADVFFIPATLRPETMYGQVCCFVGPNLSYGVFKVSEKEYYICTKRAAWNIAFQGTFFDVEHFAKTESELPLTLEFPGSAAVGTLVDAPLSVHKEVRILPMDSVVATKGTGVVTSVPSDSPDDYATIRDLVKKADYYGIKKEWADLEILPIINTPAYGDLCAKSLVEKMKISSPKDAKQLAEAKDLAYKEGYYKGTMLVGDYKGESVEVAKPKVRDDLTKAGKAFPYAEPAGQVVSRSGDECVVAHLGQWFLNYGDDDTEWRDTVSDHIRSKNMTMHPSEAIHGFEGVLDWLNRWACARTYGLGSKLPWDPKFLVESLSDSTIYMSYYTIAHFLHSDYFGKHQGKLKIAPEQMTDEAWDCVFTRRDIDDKIVKDTGISKASFETMRREFEYWYPLDYRGSAKDLIPNHLTFMLYVHAALFPPNLWPRGVRVNGHALLNGEKMSKNTGNFLTLKQAVEKFGADAMRIALADGGDGTEDANFDESVANSNILRLFTLKEWCEEVMKDATLRVDDKDAFFDKLFVNEMNGIVRQAHQHYEATDYKLALRSALYDFTGARDFYREAATASEVGMRKDLVHRYIELQALLLAPIAPHWCDYIWQEVLKKDSTIQNAQWPTVAASDASLSAAREYVRATSTNITSAEGLQLKKKSKGKAVAYDPKQPKKLTIFAAASFPNWQDKYVEMVRQQFEKHGLDNEKEFIKDVGKKAGPETKKAMPFVQTLRRQLAAGEEPKTVFDRKLGFDEAVVLREMAKGVKRTTGCKIIEVVYVDANGKAKVIAGENEGQDFKGELPPAAEGAMPGAPTFHFENVAA